jgi:pimeloyl-ACP methyl ester carboxylesterase/nucleoside-diphosphate-sugar epimerase
VRSSRSVVLGATGEIGRWLVAELTGSGENVTIVMRNAAARAEEYVKWIAAHQGQPDRLSIVEGDVTQDQLGIEKVDRASLADARLVYNLSGRYAWGLSPAEAAAVNVRGAERVVEFAAKLVGKPRVVHASGYLVAARQRLAQLGLQRDVMPSAQQWQRLYRELGAYEASKMEGDYAVRAAAKERGVNLTIINPAAVIGHSETGEFSQVTGVGELVGQLWRGMMTAIPGTPDICVPQVPVDYLVKFMARVPDTDTTPLAEYTVLSPDTPRFADLIRLMAAHLGVKAPTRFIPVKLARVLLKAGLGKLTGSSPEPLSFLVPLSFDVASAEAAALRVGLARPPIEPVIRKTLDHIIATRFGAAPSGGGQFKRLANVVTFVEGDPAKAETILLHGLPLTGKSWDLLRAKFERPALAADLPGQGRSELVAQGNETEWLLDLTRVSPGPVTLIAHSYACRAALQFASRHPDRVAHLVLIAPYFQLARLPLTLRSPASAALLLRLGGAKQLVELDQNADHLRRPGAAKSVAQRLKIVGFDSDRAALRDLLGTVSRGKVPALVIEGSNDKFVHELPNSVRHVVIEGAGHNPQITHAADVAHMICGSLGK